MSDTLVSVAVHGFCHGLAASALREWQDDVDNAVWNCDVWHKNGDWFYRTRKSAWEDALRVFAYPTRQADMDGAPMVVPDYDNAVEVITVTLTPTGTFLWQNNNRKADK